MKIGLVSLGCPKNLVDSEVMLGLARNAGHEITADAGDADVLVVNTCAFIDQAKYQYLYHDGDHWVFMQPETFDQVSVSADVVGDMAPYLTENMDVTLQSFEGNPISLEIPQRATFEIVDTEPVVKGQTASGSFKPALLSNGVKTMVPTHITTGTRVVVMTADGSYVERAKD